MRLFTAIALPPKVRGNLERLLARLKPAAPIKWSPAKNLHITTKFIGEWEEERLDELRAALEAIEPVGEIEIAVRGLGWFPNERAPRVFWAGIEAGAGLAELARRTEQRLAGLGIPVERRKFSPHLTLARIKGRVDLGPLRKAVSGLPSTEFGSFVADRFHLYVSELTPAGSIYTPLDEFEIVRAGSPGGGHG